ncbi:FG-GAP repeat domain-containing protein [Streptomyces zhihengii]
MTHGKDHRSPSHGLALPCHRRRGHRGARRRGHRRRRGRRAGAGRHRGRAGGRGSPGPGRRAGSFGRRRVPLPVRADRPVAVRLRARQQRRIRPRDWLTDQWRNIINATQADNDGDGIADDVYVWDTDGHLAYSSGEGEFVELGGGWNVYGKAYSPGDLGGAAGSDIIARDSGGTLWIYLGHGDGRLTGRTEIGGGWQIYSQIAGVGDLSGDGRNDIVARDGSGTLWLYKGTGNFRAPFEPRTEIGGAGTCSTTWWAWAISTTTAGATWSPVTRPGRCGAIRAPGTRPRRSSPG